MLLSGIHGQRKDSVSQPTVTSPSMLAARGAQDSSGVWAEEWLTFRPAQSVILQQLCGQDARRLLTTWLAGIGAVLGGRC